MVFIASNVSLNFDFVSESIFFIALSRVSIDLVISWYCLSRYTFRSSYSFNSLIAAKLIAPSFSIFALVSDNVFSLSNKESLSILLIAANTKSLSKSEFSSSDDLLVLISAISTFVLPISSLRVFLITYFPSLSMTIPLLTGFAK